MGCRGFHSVVPPTGEMTWVTFLERDDVVTHIITAKESDRYNLTRTYYLYRVKGEKLTKVKESLNPLDFDKIIEKDNSKTKKNNNIANSNEKL
jgi:hypothetical protein